jgi:hypothetical protein
LSTVYRLHTSFQVWAYLATYFAPHSKSHISHLKRQLQTMQQGSKGCFDYLLTAKNLANQLAASGKPVDNEDLISYIVGGLNSSYHGFIMTFNFVTCDKSISFTDFQDELLHVDHMLDVHQKSIPPEATHMAFLSQEAPICPPVSWPTKANNAIETTKATFNYGATPYSQRQQMPHSNHGATSYSHNAAAPSNSYGKRSLNNPSFFTTNRPPCQICGRISHQSLDCYHCMDFSFQGRHAPSQLAAMAAHTHVDVEEEQPWYLDSGANSHVTSGLENISLQQPYQGNENVTVGNGNGLQITTTGSSPLLTPNTQLRLNNILHCPNASSNLLFIQKFCKDNN